MSDATNVPNARPKGSKDPLPGLMPNCVHVLKPIASTTAIQHSAKKAFQAALSVDTPHHILRKIYSDVSNARPPDTL